MKRIPNTAIGYLRERFGKKPISYKTAFVIVVALHISAYGSLVAFSKYRESAKKSLAQAKQETYQLGPYSDALKDAWPTDNLKLRVMAKPTPKPSPSIKSVKEAVTAESKKLKSVIALSATTLPKTSIKIVSETKSNAETTKPVITTKAETPSIKPIDEVTPARLEEQAKPMHSSVQRQFLQTIKLTDPSDSISLSTEIPPTAPPVQESRPELIIEREYTIQSGDNLYTIAHKMQTSYHSIMKANNITDVRALRVGQVLKIPRRQSI